MCVHEPAVDPNGDFEGAKRIWRSGDGKVGISDSTLGLHLSRIVTEIAPRTLVIDRPVDEVVRSYANYSGASERGVAFHHAERLADLKLALMVEHPLIKRVNFDDLENVAVVRDCLDWLGVNGAMADQMMGMNVQVDYGKMLTKLRAA